MFNLIKQFNLQNLCGWQCPRRMSLNLILCVRKQRKGTHDTNSHQGEGGDTWPSGLPDTPTCLCFQYSVLATLRPQPFSLQDKSISRILMQLKSDPHLRTILPAFPHLYFSLLVYFTPQKKNNGILLSKPFPQMPSFQKALSSNAFSGPYPGL